ncbi:MAG TPA: hypothetical protein VGQ49_25190 [Bryobacteraceae bacterium]|nr:hypothetical protein [Bryobacteraceae bacterium]
MDDQAALALLGGIVHEDFRPERQEAIDVGAQFVGAGFQFTKNKIAGAIGFHRGDVYSIFNDFTVTPEVGPPVGSMILPQTHRTGLRGRTLPQYTSALEDWDRRSNNAQLQAF